MEFLSSTDNGILVNLMDATDALTLPQFANKVDKLYYEGRTSAEDCE